MPKFFTKFGWLTPYAMACGYQHQQIASDGETEVTLWCANPETNQYDVKAYALGGAERVSWECHEGIAEARKAYRRAVGTLQRRFESNPEIMQSVVK